MTTRTMPSRDQQIADLREKLRETLASIDRGRANMQGTPWMRDRLSAVEMLEAQIRRLEAVASN